MAKQVGCNECDPLPSPKVAPAVWKKLAWAMFEVEAGRKNVGASAEQDEVRKAMEEGFGLAFG